MMKPIIVCLCGSTRFSEAFRKANLNETLAGRIVLTIGCDFKSDDAIGLPVEYKQRMDELHFRKIDLADEILVLNVGGYIGQSTSREIAYARLHQKRVRFLEEEEPHVDDKGTSSAPMLSLARQILDAVSIAANLSKDMRDGESLVAWVKRLISERDMARTRLSGKCPYCEGKLIGCHVCVKKVQFDVLRLVNELEKALLQPEHLDQLSISTHTRAAWQFRDALNEYFTSTRTNLSRLTPQEVTECISLSGESHCQACGIEWKDHPRYCAGSESPPRPATQGKES